MQHFVIKAERLTDLSRLPLPYNVRAVAATFANGLLYVTAVEHAQRRKK